VASRRLGWAELNPTYRRRLQSGGITKERYESGASLSAGRGHAATPERPAKVKLAEDRYHRTATGSVLGDPLRYADYLVKQYEPFVTKGWAPAKPPRWVEYRDTTFHRAAKYIDAIGNPSYIHVWIQPDGLVITQVDRGRR
jgi:hypothetical protein